MNKFKKSVLAVGLSVGLVLSAVPVYAAAGVSLTAGELTTIDTLYNQVLALKQSNIDIDTTIKTIGKDNTTAVKNVIAAAVPIPADVTAIATLQTNVDNLKSSNAADLAQLKQYEIDIKVANSAKDEKKQMSLGIEYARLKAALKPVTDLLSSQEKDIKTKTQQLKPNAAKLQKAIVDATVKPTNDSIKTQQTAIKDLEKTEKDALKAMNDAINKGDYSTSIVQLTVVRDTKQLLYEAKQVSYGMYLTQGDALKSILTGEPTATLLPARYSKGVAVSATVSATFNEAIVAFSGSSLAGITIVDSLGNAVAGVTATINGNTVDIAHASLNTNTQYTVTIPANTIKDLTNVPNVLITYTFKTL